MNELEANLKALIIDKYGSLKKFSDTINMPWTTLDSILKRGVANSNITNVLKITRELGVDSEKLVDGKIIASSSSNSIAAHKEGESFTAEELSKIEEYKRLLIAARPKGWSFEL